ncbi:MAG: hypothetical protein Q7S22_01625 [Candidatus Micrarchaeota archaeon]|nr:hypothetical protein [Candidatus Micrarchaeota archaeon]
MVGVPIQQVKSYDCVQKSTKQSPKFKFFTPLLAEVIKTTCLRSVAIRFALSSLVLAMGCVPEERVLPSKSTIPAIEITQSEQLYWWPGHMLRNGEVVDISLGFKEVTGFPHNFISTNEISGEVRDYEKSNLQATLDFIKFFLNEDVFSTIMANNIFTFLNPKGIDNISGLYKSGVYGFSLVDQGGEEFAGCFKACPNYDLILIKQEGSRVLLHESLHDAWSSY